MFLRTCDINKNMVTSVVRLMLLCCVTGLLALPASKGKCESEMAKCLLSEENRKTGLDRSNQTFTSRCLQYKLQCEEFYLTISQKEKQIGRPLLIKRSPARGRRNKKGCSSADRVHFSNNLLSIFKVEHERFSGSASQAALVLAWKFSTIDADGNGYLDEPEYSQLRKLLKKVVQPRRCARNFGRICDIDGDLAISQKEWVSCLTQEGKNPNVDGGRPQRAQHKGESRRQHRFQKTKPALLLQGSITTQVSGHFAGSDEHVDRSKDEADSNDCLSDRKAVLDEQRNDDTVLYVPECTADGRYQNVQCYRSTGYCWCVNQDSGKNIPGTSVKDRRPECGAATAARRPMKGCPEQRKNKFLRDLMDFLNSEMHAGINGTGVGSLGSSKWPASKEEQIATWGFVMLDKNKNKILERKEWKSFRHLVSGNNLLRHCGKKLPRYCDINQDRKISITEWLNCLDANVYTTPSTDPSGGANISPTSKRKGPNPLESFLKGD